MANATTTMTTHVTLRASVRQICERRVMPHSNHVLNHHWPWSSNGAAFSINGASI